MIKRIFAVILAVVLLVLGVKLFNVFRKDTAKKDEVQEDTTGEKIAETENSYPESVLKSNLYNTKDTDYKLSVKNITMEVFFNSVEKAKKYAPEKKIIAGVLPHHTIAAICISGFFFAASQMSDYDTVVIVSPNHKGDVGDAVTSYANWNYGYGVLCDREVTDFFISLKSEEFNIKLSDTKMEDEHSASVFVPYVNYYFPDAKMASLLVTDNLSFDSIMRFSKKLSEYIKNSEKKILLICSVDFSHYLSTAESKIKDKETLDAITKLDYDKIRNFGDNNLDSSASLLTFLSFMNSNDLTATNIRIYDNTDMSEFLNQPVLSTTSYFIFSLES